MTQEARPPTGRASFFGNATKMISSRKIILRTERLYLRELVRTDSAALFELDSDPEVMRHISKGKPTSMSKIECEYLPLMLSYQGTSPPQGFWAAHLISDDQFIGWFHLRPDKFTKEEMELGYRLKRDFWGRGLATEGSKAIVMRALGEWGYDVVSARTLVVNTASRRVMEKTGLRFESEFDWGEAILPGWTVEERRGVKYSLNRAQTGEAAQ
jgi:RimJ/RimL family protein N-acetyltransferase